MYKYLIYAEIKVNKTKSNWSRKKDHYVTIKSGTNSTNFILQELPSPHILTISVLAPTISSHALDY